LTSTVCFAPEFIRSCLNRLQLKDNRQMVDLSNPNGSLQFIGTLENPIAMFRNKERCSQTNTAYSPIYWSKRKRKAES